MSTSPPIATDPAIVAATPGRSVWISAAAGSGKTRLLVMRLLRLLLAGAAPEQILCLTYTRAAAGEMRQRLTERVKELAAATPEVLASLLQALGEKPTPAMCARAAGLEATLLNAPTPLNFMTLHGFAQQLLQRFPTEAGLGGALQLLDEITSLQLQEEALQQLLEQAAQNPTQSLAKAFAAIAPYYNCGQLAQISASYSRQPALAAWRELGQPMPVIPDPSLLLAAWQSSPHWRLWLPTIANKQPAEVAWIEDFLAAPPALARQQLERIATILLTTKFEPRQKFLKDKMSGATYAALEQELQQLLQAVAAQRRASITEPLLQILERWQRTYQQLKARHHALDYDDLLVRAAQLLNESEPAEWVRLQLHSQIRHVLLDEAQDTAARQWQLLAALTANYPEEAGSGDLSPSLLVVGDPKQSIYSFQSAEPKLFAATRQIFGQRWQQQQQKIWDVSLTANYRSAPVILAATDAVFTHTIAKAGVVAEPLRHQVGRVGAAGMVELWPRTTLETPEDDPLAPLVQVTAPASPTNELANQIAARIAYWLRAGVPLLGTNRPICPDDILILLQRRGQLLPALHRALHQVGVAVEGVDRLRLTDPLAVNDILNLLQSCLLPNDDYRLAEVLKSPAIGATDDWLLPLCQARQQQTSTLWAALQQSADPLATAARLYLQQWQAALAVMPIDAWLARLLAAPCPASQCSDLTDTPADYSLYQCLLARLGPDAAEPIAALQEYAASAVASSANGLIGPGHSAQAFVTQLRRRPPTLKRDLGQPQGRVRLMTVHASKGLEAPIVILPDTVSKPKAGQGDNIWWGAAGQPVIARKFAGDMPDPTYAEAHAAALAAQTEENHRLLYVAMTRASHHLIIAGLPEKKRKKNSDDCWYDMVQAGLQQLASTQPSGQALPTTHPNFGPVAPALVLADTAEWGLPAPTPSVTAPSPTQAKSAALPPWPEQPTAVAQSQRVTAWLAPTPPSPLLTTASIPPSNLKAASAQQFGTALHQALQWLSFSSSSWITQLKLLAQQGGWPTPLADDLHTTLQRLVADPEIGRWLSLPALTEVPVFGTATLAGQAAPQALHGTLDRLVQTPQEWVIFDYKTSHQVPVLAAEISEPHRQQLAAYRALLQPVAAAAGVRLRAGLIYTAAPRLWWLD